MKQFCKIKLILDFNKDLLIEVYDGSNKSLLFTLVKCLMKKI